VRGLKGLTEPTPEGTDPPAPTRMLRLEQQVGYVLAGVAAAGAVSAATAGHDIAVGALGIAASVVLALAIHHGHRIITAITGFLAGFVLATFFLPLEIILLIYSGYLMMRTSNAQSKARRAQPTMTSAQRREAAAARSAERAKRKKGGAVAPTVAKTPPPNRRYTPPKPKPVRPVPATDAGTKTKADGSAKNADGESAPKGPKGILGAIKSAIAEPATTATKSPPPASNEVVKPAPKAITRDPAPKTIKNPAPANSREGKAGPKAITREPTPKTIESDPPANSVEGETPRRRITGGSSPKDSKAAPARKRAKSARGKTP